MNKKLKKFLEDEERTQKKIDELQDQLEGIQAARQQEENLEIVKSIRNMKLSGKELFELLCGLEDGKLAVQKVERKEEPRKDFAGKEQNGFKGGENNHGKNEFSQNH